MKNRGLTQKEAAKRMAITLPKLSDMMRGDCVKLSERELMNCFNIIGGSILDAAHGDDSSGKAVCA